GASGTLIVWDGMQDPSDYRGLLRGLTSRGRKVVLVGTSYLTEQNHARGAHLITAPALLTEGEQSRFRSYLSRFDVGLNAYFERHKADPSFLVALYRVLPPTRPQLRAGVTREATKAEQQISDRASVGSGERTGGTALAQALMDAGLLDAPKLGEGAG